MSIEWEKRKDKLNFFFALLTSNDSRMRGDNHSTLLTYVYDIAE